MNVRPSNFYFPVSGLEAERLLNTYGTGGSFIARPSSSSASGYTLSVHMDDKVKHVKIQNSGEFFDFFGGETFASLSELVQYHMENPGQLREKDGEVIILKFPLVVPPTEMVGWLFSRPCTERWYHSGISGPEAERLLLNEGKHGTFLVRESQSTPGQFAISVKAADDKNDRFDIGGGATFVNINELLEHYSRNPMVDQGGTVVHLKQQLPSTRVPATGIETRYHKLTLVNRTTGKDGFADEFAKLQQQEPARFVSRREGKKQENVSKNRYKNIIPYDHTRIILKSSEANTGDYINANHIGMLVDEYPEFSGLNRKYISTQGCLPTTIDDFWTMVWQQNSRIIVMTTREVERGRNKCCRYWPAKDETEKFGKRNEYVLKSIEKTEHPEYIMRVMEISNAHDEGSESRLIWHFQFIGWPDHGCPSDPNTVLNFLEKVNECEKQNLSKEINTIIVHCSAGIGRTGTFIVIDILLNQIKRLGPHCHIDIPRTVQMVREQRSGMVQTEQQYRFIYQAVSQYMDIVNRKLNDERRERCSSRYSSSSNPETPQLIHSPMSFTLQAFTAPKSSPALATSQISESDSGQHYCNTQHSPSDNVCQPPLKLAPPPVPKKRNFGNDGGDNDTVGNTGGSQESASKEDDCKE